MLQGRHNKSDVTHELHNAHIVLHKELYSNVAAKLRVSAPNIQTRLGARSSSKVLRLIASRSVRYLHTHNAKLPGMSSPRPMASWWAHMA